MFDRNLKTHDAAALLGRNMPRYGENFDEKIGNTSLKNRDPPLPQTIPEVNQPPLP